MSEKIKEAVKKTYTEVLTNNSGCGCGPSCCSSTQEAAANESLVDYANVEGHVQEADYGLGCGIPTQFAQIKEGDTVLDLGAGAGNDVFVARSIVGENGRVIGVDMTEAMVKKANENKQKLGYGNVEFRLGEIEDLPVENTSIDVVVSNCVMNLVPDKLKGYAEVHRVLKPQGHFSISDIVLKGELPEGIQNAVEMYAGCVAGAMPKDEYIKTIKEAGFSNVEVVQEHVIDLPDEQLLQYISAEELAIYRESQSTILSITVYASK